MESAINKLKTYSYFLNQNRFPNEYEITTSDSLYYPNMGFSVPNAIQDWYLKYQGGSALQCKDWNAFYDPSQYTYFKYVSEKVETTYILQGLFEMSRSTRYYGDLSSDWIEKLRLLYAPQIYPSHGMQMMISYAGHMAPSSRVVVVCGFQAANEISRIQTISENMEVVISSFKNLSNNSKTLWESHPIYQPLRKLIEEALIIYDWGESFVALNLCIKPILDEVFLKQFSLEALVNGDHLTSNVASQKHQDSEWQKAWSIDLVQVVLKQNPDFRSTLNGLI